MSEYTGEQIEVLRGLEAVRKRPDDRRSRDAGVAELPDGRYRVTATLEGFQAVETTVILSKGLTAPVLIDLPFAVATRVEVLKGITYLLAFVTALRVARRREGVAFLEQPYRLGETRAAMIEGPSREALELVEVR